MEHDEHSELILKKSNFINKKQHVFSLTFVSFIE